jgi:MFS family permease
MLIYFHEYILGDTLLNLEVSSVYSSRELSHRRDLSGFNRWIEGGICICVFIKDRLASTYCYMGLSMIGMIGIAFAPQFWYLLLAVVFIGLSSAIFHPEGSRIVYFAAGNRRGFAQSVYQVGGNAGSSLAPLMTVFIFVLFGQFGAIWGTLFAGFAIAILLGLLPWYKRKLAEWEAERNKSADARAGTTVFEKLDHPRVKFAMGMLIFLVFARSWYHAGISSYFEPLKTKVTRFLGASS